MSAIELYDANLLLQKQEPKQKQQFSVTGDSDPNAPLYVVKFAGPQATAKVGDVVILKPGAYEAVRVNDEQYTFAESDQVAGKVGK